MSADGHLGIRESQHKESFVNICGLEIDKYKCLKTAIIVTALIALTVFASAIYGFIALVMAGEVTVNSIIALGVPASVSCGTVIGAYFYYGKAVREQNKELVKAQNGVGASPPGHKRWTTWFG